MIVELLWLLLALFHTLPFGLYILYMKRVTNGRPWNVRIDDAYEPTVSLIVPTYNEAGIIEAKLNNLAELEYPRTKMEVVLVDSASSDGTASAASLWAAQHPQMNVKVIEEQQRRGMVSALNRGLRSMKGEIFAKTDADCLLFRDSLRNAVKYLNDPAVGSVAGLHVIAARRETNAVDAERTYRHFYSWLRTGESKLHSTPLYEGEFMLVKKRILDQINGFDETIGADDVPTALRIVAEGYRAISVDDVRFMELTPFTWKERIKQKVRRARHVIQALRRYGRVSTHGKTVFQRLIFPMEFHIYVVNPILFVPLVALTAMILLNYPVLLISFIVLVFKSVRTVVITQLTNMIVMVAAIAAEIIWRRQAVTWSKIDQIRSTSL